MTSTTVGTSQHERAVRALMDDAAQAAAAHPDRPVRLAKKTTNLFRERPPAGDAGLDVDDLTHVIAVDTEARTADVQGMCTYDELVRVTLAHGLVPSVVPQLRTITVGGALAGLGIESTSLMNGLPHEAVLEMDVLTPTGALVTATPTNEHADLFRAFPNSYGTLGYAVRVRLRLDVAGPFVAVRNVQLGSAQEAQAAFARIADDGAWEGEPVHFCDGVWFGPDDVVLCLGRFVDAAEGRALAAKDGADAPSSYTGQGIYWLSLHERTVDVLRTADYLWRWDTDWFWCSRAFGAQNPVVRRLWPARWRRSDVYRRLVALDARTGFSGFVDRVRGLGPSERVIQDVEVPLERMADFLGWFDTHVPMRPVWLCPLRLASSERWPLYPLEPGRVYVNLGFWGVVRLPDGARDGDVNRSVEEAVAARDGHKSLYSTAQYGPDEFATLYGGDAYDDVKRRYDPTGRAVTLYEKVVRSA